MPHVLWEFKGTALAHMKVRDGVHHTPTYADLEIITPGKQSEEEYDQTIRDLVNLWSI